MSGTANICRFAVNLSNTVLARIDADGTLKGLAVEISEYVAAYFSCEPLLVRYSAAAEVLADTAAWDIAFLAVDLARADRVLFTAPYLKLDVGCVVRLDSSLTDLSLIDQPEVSIACAQGGYARMVRDWTLRANIIDMSTPTDALTALIEGEVDCAIGLVPSLDEASQRLPLRRLEDVIGQVEHALAVPAERPDLFSRVEEALASYCR